MDSVFKSAHHDKYSFIDPSNAPLKDSAKGKTVLVTGASRGIGKVKPLPPVPPQIPCR
jgi:hypothetical protein